LSVAREYIKRNLPISVIVGDFYHWPVTGDWKFNHELWPEPTDVPNHLKECQAHAKLMYPKDGRPSEDRILIKK
jgi:alpha-glucosidase (family GH31 glycosyl hydrolase)